MEHISKTIEAVQNGSATNSTNSHKKPLTEAKLSDVWVLALFKKFQARYLHKWTSAIEGIEEQAMQEWGQVLAGLEGGDIKRGLEKLPGEWPPTAGEFKQLCKKPIDPLEGAYRCLPKPQVDPGLVEEHIKEMREKIQ